MPMVIEILHKYAILLWHLTDCNSLLRIGLFDGNPQLLWRLEKNITK